MLDLTTKIRELVDFNGSVVYDSREDVSGDLANEVQFKKRILHGPLALFHGVIFFGRKAQSSDMGSNRPDLYIIEEDVAVMTGPNSVVYYARKQRGQDKMVVERYSAGNWEEQVDRLYESLSHISIQTRL